jgi:hypothetical protein
MGLLLVLVGVLLIVVPLLIRHLPDLERLPWFILYIYRADGFFFATSPILLVVLVLLWVWWGLARS